MIVLLSSHRLESITPLIHHFAVDDAVYNLNPAMDQLSFARVTLMPVIFSDETCKNIDFVYKREKVAQAETGCFERPGVPNLLTPHPTPVLNQFDKHQSFVIYARFQTTPHYH